MNRAISEYQDLGGDYFDRQNALAYRTKLVHKLEALGLKVSNEPATTLSDASV